MKDSTWTRAGLLIIAFLLTAGSGWLLCTAKGALDFVLSLIAFAGFSVSAACATMRRAA